MAAIVNRLRKGGEFPHFFLYKLTPLFLWDIMRQINRQRIIKVDKPKKVSFVLSLFGAIVFFIVGKEWIETYINLSISAVKWQSIGNFALYEMYSSQANTSLYLALASFFVGILFLVFGFGTLLTSTNVVDE